jgi:hypothetical protein
MVHPDWAFDWSRYSGSYYVADQNYARVNHLGQRRKDTAFFRPWYFRMVRSTNA